MKFDSLLSLLQVYDTEDKCREFFEDTRWHGHVVCLHCHTDKKKIYKLKRGIFRCSACGKDFSVRTGAYLGESHIKYQQWLMALYLVTSHKKGISSTQLSRDIGCTQKTAWFMLQRINHIVSRHQTKLDGTVEVDETYVGGSERFKHANKRTTKYNIVQGEKAIILGMIKRGDKLMMRKIDKINKANIKPIIDKHLDDQAIVQTDESPIYKGALGLRERHLVNHKAGQYVLGNDTTNRIEGMFSHLKRMIDGVHIFLSHKHLEQYTDMFCFRMNTRKAGELQRICLLLSQVENTRWDYKQATR